MIVQARQSARLPYFGVPPLAAVVLIAVVLGALGLTNHELWTADEPREAGLAREMWRSGSWLVPRLSGAPFLEKPPLYWWSVAGMFQLFGRSDVVLARLPSAVFALGALLLTLALARLYFGARAAVLSGLVLVTTTAFAMRSHWVIVDTALLFGVVGALTCFAHAEQRDARERPLWLLGTTVFLVLSFFSKGVIGLGMPLLGALAYSAWRRRLREFLPPLALGAAVAVGLAGLWLWGLWREAGSSAVWTFAIYNQIGRFVPGLIDYTGGHERPFYYYLYQLPVEIAPCTPLAVLAALAAWRSWPELPERERAGLQLVAATGLPVLLVLSVAGTKRGLYLLPLAPFSALAVAWWICREQAGPAWESRWETIWRRGLLAGAVLLPAVPLILERAAWPWLVASALLAVGAWAAEATPAPERSVRCSRVLLLAAAAWACLLVAGPPLLDRTKSLEPVARDIERLVPAGAELCALDPSETLRGVIAFYTDRTLCLIPDIDALRERAGAQPPSFVLLERARRRYDPKRLRRNGLDFAVEAELGSGDRAVYLLRFAGAGVGK